MHDSFASLLQTPTAARYKRVRSLLLATTSLGEFSLQLAELEVLLAQGNDSAAQALVRELQSAGLLSLKWHRLAGTLALKLGNAARAELHKFSYDALRQAILSTGNGTRKKPYVITYASDAHELALASGHCVNSQSMVEVKAHRYDVLLCSHEHEFWFDITDLVPVTATAMVRKRRPQEDALPIPRREKAVGRTHR